MNHLITEQIIGAAIEVHRHLGPGLLESTYERCLAREFDIRQILYERQKACSIIYKGFLVEEGYRIDFLVANQIIVEIKSVDTLTKVQIITYLRLLEKRHGLLLNFNVSLLKSGIKRYSL